MWLMLQQDSPDDFVIATGVTYSVEDFVKLCFEHVGLDWKEHVRHDDRYVRPTEVDVLVGDASKAARLLGWRASTLTPQLAGLMVDAEVATG
jgi:GDPmannose 4,6-dehydratase